MYIYLPTVLSLINFSVKLSIKQLGNMKQINIVRLLAISLLFVGCHKDDDDDETNLVALNEIDLVLNRINVVTRAEVSADHPTMVPPSQRDNFNLKITIGSNSATYIYNKNTLKWVPQSDPVCFSTAAQPETVFFECFYNAPPSDNDQSSALSILANDILVGRIDNQKPVNVIDKVYLTHKNAVIEVVLSDILMNKADDVYINNIKAFREGKRAYQIIINESQKTSTTIPFSLKTNLDEYSVQLEFPVGIFANTWYSFSLILSEDFYDVELVMTDWVEKNGGEQAVKRKINNEK